MFEKLKIVSDFPLPSLVGLNSREKPKIDFIGSKSISFQIKSSIISWQKERQVVKGKMHLLEIRKQPTIWQMLSCMFTKRNISSFLRTACLQKEGSIFHHLALESPCINFSSGPRYVGEPCAQKALCPCTFTFLHWRVNPFKTTAQQFLRGDKNANKNIKVFESLTMAKFLFLPFFLYGALPYIIAFILIDASPPH